MIFSFPLAPPFKAFLRPIPFPTSSGHSPPMFLFFFLLVLSALLPSLCSDLEFCGPPLLLSGGVNSCPASSSGLKTVDGRTVCCGYPTPVENHSPEGKPLGGKKPGGKYCGPYLTVDNIPRCPESHPYDASRSGKNRCCGDEPIGQREGGGRRNASCVDLAAPGRPSDCPANKHRCNDSLWRELMTEQCPKTCGRCGEAAAMRDDRGSLAVCRDGIGPTGVSECPQNEYRCKDPIWKAFMEKECPKTCGVCGRRTTKGPRRSTSRRTTNTASSSSSTSTTMTTSTEGPLVGR